MSTIDTKTKEKIKEELEKCKSVEKEKEEL